MAHDRTRQHRADQARPTIADQLESITGRFDTLTHRARLGRLTPAEYDELEEDAQAIAHSLLEVFRARRIPTNPPLFVSRDGTKAAW